MFSTILVIYPSFTTWLRNIFDTPPCTTENKSFISTAENTFENNDFFDVVVRTDDDTDADDADDGADGLYDLALYLWSINYLYHHDYHNSNIIIVIISWRCTSSWW